MMSCNYLKRYMLDFIIMEENSVKIAVLSGKGGTGKTLVSVNMAAVAKGSVYIDCDIEEPNGHLFFKPEDLIKEEVTVRIPFVDQELCNGCRKCVEFCKFNALAYINNNLILFDEMCHSCGGCVLFCPQKALKEKEKAIGQVQKGLSENVIVCSGILNTGEASGVPIINKLLQENLENNKINLIDCPPGSACIVMDSIKDADYCVLVAEPTLFGVHNLNMVYELVKLFYKPHGIIINKWVGEEALVEEFCAKNNVKILGKIPFDKDLGIMNSNAYIAVRESKKYRELFENLLESVLREVSDETIINS